MKQHLASSVFTLWLLAFPGVCLAQEAPFTFNVDVDVRELHKQVTRIHVRCGVYGLAEGVALGLGDATQRLTKGAFKGSVKVAVQMLPARSPVQATRYACRLRLVVSGRAPAKPSLQSTSIPLRPSSGAPFTPLISGDL